MDFKERLVRQSELIPFETLDKQITIIGAGAIGSFTSLSLAKVGFQHQVVFDPDHVDTANMNCQFYRTTDIGKNKVEALHSLVKDFTSVEIKQYPVPLMPKMDIPHTDILISAVDSMEVRKELWERAKIDRRIKWFIDGRMGGETILLYVMNPKDPKDIAAYEKTLYSTEEAEHERCTMKATIYTVNLIAGLITKAVKDIAVGYDKYTRIISWDLSHNSYMGFNKKVEEK
jgi:molybdopterin/thiamine biosynthesis adenylyltransferase